MRPALALATTLLIASAVLAGCLGGDDDPLETGNGSSEPAEGTGSITGRILTQSLDEVANANVALVADGELAAEARTDDDGRYTLSDIEPGDYRLQVTAACCREAVQGVTVIEGETQTIDLQLTRFTAADLQQPFVQEFEFQGLMACGITAVLITGSLCGELDDEDQVTEHFQLDPGIKTVTAGLVWEATGGVLGDELRITLSQDPCDDGSICSPSDHYGEASGSSPVELRVDGGGAQSFEGIEEPVDVQIVVLPEFGADVYYQQRFTVYYQLHYHEAAPEGYNPIPDL